MKNLQIGLALLLALLLASCNKASSPDAIKDSTSSAAPPDAEIVVDLAVAGMHCASCAQTIQTELVKLDGVSSCSASFEKGHVIVSFDGSKVTEQRIREEILALGYTVTGYAHEESPTGGETAGPVEGGGSEPPEQSGI